MLLNCVTHLNVTHSSRTYAQATDVHHVLYAHLHCRNSGLARCYVKYGATYSSWYQMLGCLTCSTISQMRCLMFQQLRYAVAVNAEPC
jgi:hypothetical protein